MRMRRPGRAQTLAACVLLGVIALGAGLRFAALESRPFHGDEANQAMRAGILLEEGEYRYDPHEHHGPTLYYLSLIPLRLAGVREIVDAREAHFRVVPAFFGTLAIAAIWLLRPGLGASGVALAALLMALSPAMSYYSRYFVQEMLLICFLLGAIIAGWRYLRAPGPGWAAAFGAACGLMHATKETCILLFAAMAGGAAGAWMLGRLHRPLGEEAAPFRVRPADAAAAALAGLVISVTLFSSFLTHPRGVLDSVLTYATYIERADGTGSAGPHDKPWNYYLSLLWHTQRGLGRHWSEAYVLLLGGLGALAAFCTPGRAWGDPRLVRFLACFTLLCTAMYSAIPYKTPWNLLPFLTGFILLAGAGGQFVVHSVRPRALRVALAGVLALPALHLAHQAHEANFRYAADVTNPYVYAHTSTNLRRLVERVDELAAIAPPDQELHINIVKPDADYWPLPWHFRGYSRVGYWVTLPERPDADIIIADPDSARALQPALRERYVHSTYSLRPNVLLLMLVREPLWEAFMADRV